MGSDDAVAAAAILRRRSVRVKAAIALGTSVTETKGVASEPVLPNHAPEGGPCDRTSTPGIRGGDARPLSAGGYARARTIARRVLPHHKRLRPILPALLTALTTHHGLVLAPAVRGGPDPWAGVAPGARQGDLVLHCGASTAGRYCATLVAVDVATSWTELQALYDLHHQRVTGAIQHIHDRLPVPLRARHSDHGGEFINAALLGWCRRRGIRFTRGRPYRKNDQAWVEQRNGQLVRRLVGYDRYTSRAAWAVLRRLYDLLRLQHNFFRPARKLLHRTLDVLWKLADTRGPRQVAGQWRSAGLTR